MIKAESCFVLFVLFHGINVYNVTYTDPLKLISQERNGISKIILYSIDDEMVGHLHDFDRFFVRFKVVSATSVFHNCR